ncbi:enhancer of mRNA decapping [Gnomoniopsis smithogilvyi]|uniref:Enhancer of mRNA-decapping protein 3 n=1 Tax=Gnomoniopsis smithogilvyi TaxID=1191159 RepID=A0A9W8YT54_9PEZI|nr:enhancer of mRNA decapping [Gnomoniopsis smithogilvyi]
MFVRMKIPPYTVTGKIDSIVPGRGVVLQIWNEAAQRVQRLEIASADIEDVKMQDEHGVPPAPLQSQAQQRAYQQTPAPAPPVHQQQQQQQHPVQFPAYQNQNIRSPMVPMPIPTPQFHPAQGYHQQQQQQQPVQPSMVQGPYPTASQHPPAPPQQPQQPKSAFVDPAILSMGKPPVRASPATAAPNNLPSSAIASPSTAQPPFSMAPHSGFSQLPNGTTQSPVPKITVGHAQSDEAPQRVLVETMESLSMRAELADKPVEMGLPADGGEQEDQDNQASQRKNRRRNRQSKKGATDNLDVEASPARGSRSGKKDKGKGWRETPILEDTAAFQPYKALRRTQATQDGWASEDVTDVQEAGEFDFEGSLKRFDKKTIFGEMQEKDQVDESDRLVSHNRVPRPKPGTAGGKNLHYTENVLETPSNLEKPSKTLPDDFWKSEADDGARNGSERLSGRELGSRQSSRRGEGKAVAKGRSQSRKASTATVVGQAPSRTNSGLPTGASSSAGFINPQSKKRIEILSPLQMLNLENIAQNDLGLTEDMMTENAARGMAEVALHTLTDPAIRVRLAAADGSAPEPATVVILAGNNKSGYRSIAAGRHLRNKGVNVILCVVGIEKGERDLSVDMTKQLRLFKNFGGKVCSKSELFEFVRKASIPVISMDAPRSVLPQAPPMAVTLIIDALLGHVTPFEDLRAADQATVYELIEWTNRNEAFVLAVDVPTGIDHTTGAPTVQDGHSLYIRPRYVVSIGAPKKGLFEHIAAGATDGDEHTTTGHVSDDAVLDWNLFLIDIGLGAAVWKRAGARMRRGIDFGNRWALQFAYQSSEADQAEE